MKIVILTGSHREGSNSEALANSFARGAKEAGHEIYEFRAAHRKIHPCIGCDTCGMDGPCIYKDDIEEELRNKIITADVVVLASPMYYFGLSAQIKIVIDRFYAFNPHVTGNKRAFLFIAYGGDDPKTAEGITKQYEIICDFLKWKDCGRILAPNVNAAGDILKTAFPEQAFELGKKLK